MTEKTAKNVQQDPELEVNEALEKAKDFWTKYSKPVSSIGLIIIALGVGYYAYKTFIVAPKKVKANDAIAAAQDYFAMDSLDLALNGDGRNVGFLRIESNYGGTDAANLAHYYAGAIYLRKQDFPNAIKQLKDFSTNATQVQSSAYRMLGDACMDGGRKEEGANYYKMAGSLNDKDPFTSSENLFRAALAYETIGKNDEAIALYKEVKEKYPKTDKGMLVDKYLARLGVTQ
jgi:tetratricopeptide (TPR) repeat protein